MAMENQNYIDYIVGSSELLLFDIEMLISNIDTDLKEFTWITKRSVLDALGNITSDNFATACLLSGSYFSPTFPPLKAQSHITQAVSSFKAFNNNLTGICMSLNEDEAVQKSFLDRYRRAFLAVKHHVILFSDGAVGALYKEAAPNDVHIFMGQRLPEEIYFYLSRGLIGPRVLQIAASGKFTELPPLEGGDSEKYRQLIQDTIPPIRTQALSLLSQTSTRFYQYQKATTSFWYDKDLQKELTSHSVLRDNGPTPGDITSTWVVKGELFKPISTKVCVNDRKTELNLMIQ
jgi:Temperature dependent protein affecting M2 dsRNA replication